VYDVDPLRVLADFVRISSVEFAALGCFVKFPITVIVWARQRLFDDLHEQSLPLPVVGIGSETVESLFGGPPLVISAYALGFLTLLGCFFVFPIQKYQLRLLLPFAEALSSVLGLDAFLFDKDRLAIVNVWLSTPGADELELPETPVEHVLVGRKHWFHEKDRPSWLILRTAVFSIGFYVVSTVGVWTTAICIAVLCAGYTSSILLLLLICGTLPFIALDPKRYFTTLLQVVALILALAFGVLWFGSVAAINWWNGTTWQGLLLETVEYAFDARRSVVPYQVKETRDKGTQIAGVTDDSAAEIEKDGE
jgi:hypothetical protein